MVMAGLDAAIRAESAIRRNRSVDGPVKSGHGELGKARDA